jgi:hypothetical protein
MQTNNPCELLTATMPVGSGDWLGCWWFKLATIAALLCVVMALVGDLREKLKEYKRRREYRDKYCKPNKPPVGALGNLGDANIKRDSRKLKSVGIGGSVSKESANLVSRGTQKPRFRLELIMTVRNLFWCLSFRAHKSNDVAKQPNCYSTTAGSLIETSVPACQKVVTHS